MFVVIADSIGQIKIPVGKGTFILFPIFYAIILGVCSGPQVLKLVDNRHVKAASKLVVVGIAPFIAKMGITAGSNIDTILNAGPALLVHGFGNLLGPVLALPVAILLGMKREAVGACHSINREYHMALINNIYGPDSAEARGSLSIYIVGGMVGTIYFGLMASFVGMTGLFHPQALGLASGVGAGIMMASASASPAPFTRIWPRPFLRWPASERRWRASPGFILPCFLRFLCAISCIGCRSPGWGNLP